MDVRTKRESRVVDALEAWTEAGRKLSQYDSEKFQRLLSVARAFVALFERGVEDAAIFNSRLRQISSKGSKVTS